MQSVIPVYLRAYKQHYVATQQVNDQPYFTLKVEKGKEQKIKDHVMLLLMVYGNQLRLCIIHSSSNTILLQKKIIHPYHVIKN